MPLINCPACSKSVSDQAPTCPNCGHPIKREENRTHVVYYRGRDITGVEELNRLQYDGWQIIDERDEQNSDDSGRVVYTLRR